MLKTFGYRKTSYLEFYAQVLSRICSGINRCSYDLVIVRDYFFGAYLTVDVSTVYIGDTTFRLFKANLNMPSAKFEEIADEVEKRMIQNADSIIFSSNWAKESALKDYLLCITSSFTFLSEKSVSRVRLHSNLRNVS